MEIKNNLNKLDPYLNRAELEGTPSGAQHSAGVKSSAGVMAQEGDKVSLSTTGLKDVVAQEAMRAPGIRQDKVDAIKARIASGDYEIDSQNIAARMLEI